MTNSYYHPRQDFFIIIFTDKNTCYSIMINRFALFSKSKAYYLYFYYTGFFYSDWLNHVSEIKYLDMIFFLLLTSTYTLL